MPVYYLMFICHFETNMIKLTLLTADDMEITELLPVIYNNSLTCTQYQPYQETDSLRLDYQAGLQFH